MNQYYERAYGAGSDILKGYKDMFWGDRANRRITTTVFAGGAALFAAVALIMPEQHDTGEVIAAANADGFMVAAGEGGVYATGDTADLKLDLGDCVLKGVDAQLVTEDGHVTDISEYSVSGTINGEEVRKHDILSSYTVIEGGTEVTLTFTNLADMKARSLGDQPCATLAANNFIPSDS